MFEDFKIKVGNLQNKHENEIPLMYTTLAQEIIEKLQKSGIAPDNVTIEQLFPETLDPDGNDLSLMSGAEWEIMITYAKTRKYLLERYPQSLFDFLLLRLHPWVLFEFLCHLSQLFVY
jgi:hypothetical protein